MGFPAVKIFCYFLFRQPYPRSFYPFHNSGNDFPVVAFMRLLSLFYPKAAVFFIKPCTDSFFLPLFQMSKLLICPQQLPVYLFMIFCPDFFFPLFPFLQGEIGGGLLSASLWYTGAYLHQFPVWMFRPCFSGNGGAYGFIIGYRLVCHVFTLLSILEYLYPTTLL